MEGAKVREWAAYRKGVRTSIEWLHERAKEMNDPHARAILNTAAFHLGVDLKRALPSPPKETSE